MINHKYEIQIYHLLNIEKLRLSRFRSCHRRCSVKKVLLEILQNSQEYTWATDYLQPQACNFIKKESLTQVFCCEFWEISKNNFFIEHLRTTAFEDWFIKLNSRLSFYSCLTVIEKLFKKSIQRYSDPVSAY